MDDTDFLAVALHRLRTRRAQLTDGDRLAVDLDDMIEQLQDPERWLDEPELEMLRALVGPGAPINLAKHAHPHYPYSEWRFGGSAPSAWGPGYAVTGYRTPDPHGFTAFFRRSGWTRDELPGLAAFLLAVYEASAPAAEGEAA